MFSVQTQTHVIAFLTYSFFGATLEHLNYYLGRLRAPKTYKPKALLNAVITGFPIYGIGAYTVAGLHQAGVKRLPLPLQFLTYATALSGLEYGAGKIVGAGPTSYTRTGMIQSWDYSKQRYQIGGMVSLRHFVTWGLFGLLIAHVVHPIVMRKAAAAARA